MLKKLIQMAAVIVVAVLALMMVFIDDWSALQPTPAQTPVVQHIEQIAEPAREMDETTSNVPASRWQTRERKRARQRLAAQDFDVLIVPFQVEGHGLDATARSLMTLSLAQRIANSTELTVADPVLVDQAFGSGVRQISNDDIEEVLQSTDAVRVLTGKVGHRDAETFHVKVEKRWYQNGILNRDSRTTILDEQSISFDDVNTPYFEFLRYRDAIVREFEDEMTGVGAEMFAVPILGVPTSFTELQADASSSTLAAVYYLQFLGVLHPQNLSDRAADRLFERSLVILEGIDSDATNYSLLRARALTYLNRRPAALAELSGSNSTVSNALRSYLNGNLPDLIALQNDINTPLLAMIANIELERLRLKYEGAADINKLTEVAGSYDDFSPLLYEAFNDNNRWRQFSNVPLKLALDLNYPNANFSLEAFEGGILATGAFNEDQRIAKLVFKHLEDIDSRASDQDSDADFHLEPNVSDFTDLVRNMLIGNIVHRTRHISRAMANPESAIEFANKFESVIADHPDLTYAAGAAYERMAEPRSSPARSDLTQKSYEMTQKAFLWIGHITPDSAWATKSPYFFPAYRSLSNEERQTRLYLSDWPLVPNAAQIGDTTDERNSSLSGCLSYTIADFECFSKYHDNLNRIRGKKDEAEEIFAANRDRFVGHPKRLDYLAMQELQAGRKKAAWKIYSDAIDSQTTDRLPYERVGRDLIRKSRFNDALYSIQRYPGFTNSTIADPVALSNYAFEMGSLLFWAGAYEQAKPLFELAAGYETGSAASITSAVRLALIDGDYETAIAGTQRRAQRYQSKFALRDLVGLAALFGDTESAWAIINGVQDRFGDAELWTGTLIAHRAIGASQDEIAEWAFKDGRGELRNEIRVPALRYVFMANTLDRVVSSSLSESLRKLDPRPRPIRSASGVTEGDGSFFRLPEILPLREVEFYELPPEKLGEIDRLLVIGADALALIESKEYQRAYEILDDAAGVYDLNEFLPYYALAAAKSGQIEHINAYLARSIAEKDRREAYQSREQPYFDEYLSLALIRGTEGKHSDAIDYLKRTNSDVLHTSDRSIPTRYQILEVAKMLYDDTGNDDYRRFALDMARKYAVIEPIQSYTHSLVAMLSDDRNERIIALARAIFLDPETSSISTANPTELEAARKLADKGYPMPRDEALARI